MKKAAAGNRGGFLRVWMLLLHLGCEHLLRDLPAAFDLQQQQIVGEEARRQLALELDESRCRSGLIDLENLVMSRQTLRLA